MDMILLLASTPEDAYKSISYICEDVKNRSDADHKLYFSRIMFGAFHISKGEVVETELAPGMVKKDSALIGNHELIIFPSANEDHIKKLKENKTTIFTKNCMSVAGPSEKKVEFRKAIIDWLLDDSVIWDYANIDISDS